MASRTPASANVSGSPTARSAKTAKVSKSPSAAKTAKASKSASAAKPAAAAKIQRAANPAKAPRKAAKKTAPASTSAKKSPARKATAPKLLSGGNPQIAKGHGDAPVQAYIAAMPGWKRATGARLDALIDAAVPGVRKAVKWNSPLYGVGEDSTWFLSLHVFASYIKVAFFAGRDLDPMPPGESKTPRTRYLNLREGELDEARFVDWVKQASKRPGERM